MSDSTIHCDAHGDAFETFVCGHLIDGDDMHWHSAEPDDENAWPSAWCSKCHVHFEAQGEWNDASEEAADIGNVVRLMCHVCYEQLRDRCSVTYI